LDYLQAQNSKLEIASAFLLKKGEDKKINILFQDAETLELYKDSLINFANEFQEFFNVQSTTLRSNPNNVRDLFRARNDTGRLDLYGLMGTHFYWQPGNYIFEVTFHTDGSRKSYKFKYGFSLLTSQVETLNLNRVLLLEMAMNAEVKANFAFTETTELSS
jgi:hypothetical protein